jgi:hypothetical protein
MGSLLSQGMVTRMSRRWYRHAEQVIFVGWEPSEQGFYVNVVDLCARCGGTGEEEGSEEVCPGCGGEGVELGKLSPSERLAGLTLDSLAARLTRDGLPFPDIVRRDLQEDQRTNAGMVLSEYEI